MFDRFTEHARKSMSLARQEAQKYRHDYIGTEHILLGVLASGSDEVVAVFRDSGVTEASVRDGVEEIVRPGAREITYGQIPFTPRAKKVLELALEEAQHAGHRFIAAGHLLLGLIREDEGIAAQVLAKRGVKLDRARALVKPMLDAEPIPPASAPSPRLVPTVEIVGRDGAVLLSRRCYFPTAFTRGDLVRFGDAALRIVDVVHTFPADEGPPSIRLVVEPT